jgi:membrane-anchored protein YejM (alkaline phosphatase superfamily)
MCGFWAHPVPVLGKILSTYRSELSASLAKPFDWADSRAEMDYRAGQILDAVKQAEIENNTLVIFTSHNGPEVTHPWEGDSGPWRDTEFTAMEASLHAPFIIRWPTFLGMITGNLHHAAPHCARAPRPRELY